MEDRVQAFLLKAPPQTISAPCANSDLDRHIERYCTLIKLEQYAEAHAALQNEKALSAEQKCRLRAAISKQYLYAQELEWSGHGVWKSFRFWSLAEKVEYLHWANEVVRSLKKITPYVTFGFGSVLGFVRENDFIPHDDDMDLLVALPATESSTFAEAKKLLMDHVAREGFNVYNENMTHFTSERVDVFIGFIESNESVSWFPSKSGNLKLTDVFPTSTIEILKVPVEIPGKPEHYLEVTYGPNWRDPDSNWKHPWDQGQYRKYRIGEKA